MNDLLTEYSEEFGKSVLDVFNHKHTEKNLKKVEEVTDALLVLSGNQDLLTDFAKYYVANIIQQNSILN